MGHYDSCYEYDERKRRESTKKEAAREATRLKVTVLPPSKFEVIGICGHCANLVRAVPNWGCRTSGCPHKP